jgi:tRNA pseudouridine38-40 synthase
VRAVLRLVVSRRFEQVIIDVEGSGFLYNQVRNMVGTLMEIGRGHWEPAYAAEILAGCDRSKAGGTAPARGLCLQWVRYDLTRSAESYIRPQFERAIPEPDAQDEDEHEDEVE